ncbi:MAG: TolC family protein, partial [Balneolaceae bacterium]|nr:TolC family protein [Balneolaceae bacterium]
MSTTKRLDVSPRALSTSRPLGRLGIFSLFVWIVASLLPSLLQAQSVDGTAGEQSPLKVTLQEALQMAREQNTQNRMADADIEIARSAYHNTNSLFLPQLSVEETAITTNNPLNVFGTKLRQENVTASDFDPALLNDPDRIENFTTSINVQQPLLNPSGILGRQARKKQLDASRMQAERTQAYVDFQVKQTWYQLILARRRAGIIDTALTAARANADQARNFFEQGMINQADLLAAEVRVRQLRNGKTEADNEYSNTQRRMAYLLGLEKEQEVEPAGMLKQRAVQQPELNLEAVNRNRSDMRALEYQVEATR